MDSDAPKARQALQFGVVVEVLLVESRILLLLQMPFQMLLVLQKMTMT